MSNIVIDIAAQFTGKKAFSSSEKAINNLAKSIKRAALGGGIATLMASSVKAFAADEKAAAMLGNTLKNLGLQTFTASVEAMIDKTQLATGVLDDQLRPAFQKLVTSTGDAIQAQELLKLSLDVSAGSGNDLVTVASDIANVMAGNNKGLKKYALGLSAVELKTMSATEVQLKFLEVYGGASEKVSKTFAGSLGRIKASAEMARESLGKGLVDGLMIATGSANIEQLQQQILDFGVSAGDAFKKLGTLIRENLGLLKTLAITFAAIWTAGKVIAGIDAIIKILNALNKTYKLLRATAVGTAIAQMAVLNPIGALAYGATLVAAITVAVRGLDLLTDKFNSTSDAADRLAAPRLYGGVYADKYLKEKAAFEKKQLADQLAKDKAAIAAKEKAEKLAAVNKKKLAEAAAVFDIQKIQIAAALKGKISEEERTRLLLMQAIADEDADKAEKLAKKLEEIQAKNAKIAADLLAISATKDPFATWAGSLSLALLALGKLGKGIADVPGLVPGVNFNPTQNADRNYDMKVAAVEAVVAATIAEITGNGDAAAILGGDDAGTILAGAGITFNPGQNPDRNYDDKAAAEAAAAAAAAALAIAPTNNSLEAGVTYNPSQNADRNYDAMNSNQAPTIIVNNNGSVIMQDEFVDAVNNALLAAERTGYNRTPAGFLIE